MKITLPKDKTRVAQLKRKLAEYEARLENKENDDFFNSAISRCDSICKAVILKELIDNGETEKEKVLDKIEARLSDEKNTLPAGARFSMAFLVIEDYCKTGGETVMGGTGLS